MLERGAVEGEIFHRGAVQALAPEETEVLPRLAALVRHELIRPDRPQLPGDDGFRFRHLLIRDAAYDALPKAVRADLHRRLADWLEEQGGPRRAGRGRRLPPRAGRRATRPSWAGPTPRSPSARAIGSSAAGRRALDRGDERAAAGAARAGAHADAAAPLLTSTPNSTSHRPSGTTPSEPPRSPSRRPCGQARPATRPGEALARAIGCLLPLDASRRVRAGRARDAPPRRTPPTRGGGGSRRADLRLVGARLRRCERARPPRRLGDGVRAGAPPQPARRSRGAARDHLGGALVAWIAAGGRGARGRRSPARRDGVAGAAAQPRLAARDARPRRGGPAGRRTRRTRGSASRAPRAGATGTSPRSRTSPATTRKRATGCASSATGSKRRRTLAHLETYLPLLGRSLCLLGRFDEAEQLAKRARAIDEWRGRSDDDRSISARCWPASTRTAASWPKRSAWRGRRSLGSERTDSLNMQAEALLAIWATSSRRPVAQTMR